MDRGLPYTSKVMFYGRYIPEDNFHKLMPRLSVMLTPAASERAGQLPFVTHVESLKLGLVVPHDPVSPAKYGRETVTCRILTHLVDFLSAGEADGSLS